MVESQIELSNDYTKVDFSKVDMTGKHEVKGARLVLCDAMEQKLILGYHPSSPIAWSTLNPVLIPYAKQCRRAPMTSLKTYPLKSRIRGRSKP